MNKDKIELEEAIKQCNNLIAILPNFHLGGSDAIETVLQELENSIPKKKIEELKNKFKKPDNTTTYYFKYNLIQEELDKLLEDK